VVSDRAGIKQLVAYVIATAPLEREGLRSFLSTKLPEYMIPNSFVEVAEFPLTPNGKIDKRNLPNPATAKFVPFKNAGTEVEASLASAWKDVLKLEVVGLTDNFFELGGNSILAQKLSSILLKEGLPFPVTKVYQCPTIVQAAGFLTGELNQKRKKKRDVAFRESRD